jgi:site-specific recombinase XerD
MPAISSQLRPFLEHLEIEKGRSLLTVRNYDFYIKRFIDWAKDPDTEEITASMIHNYRLYLNRLEVKDDQTTLKKSTQNYHLIALRSFLKFLAKRDIKSLITRKDRARKAR